MASTTTPRGDATKLYPLMPAIQAASNKYNVPVWLIGAIIMHESGGQPGAVQPNGQGRGLMQVDAGYHPEANDPRMTGTSSSDIAFQIDTGTRILRDSIAAANGDVTQGVQNYAGANYSNNGQTFPAELASSYVNPVLTAMLGYAANHGNYSLLNNLKQVALSGPGLGLQIAGAGPAAVGNAISAATQPFTQFWNLINNKTLWQRLGLVTIGIILFSVGVAAFVLERPETQEAVQGAGVAAMAA